MLKIEVNLYPYGVGKKETLNTIKIHNTGNGSYRYGIEGDGINIARTLFGFDRGNGALGLLKMVLNECDEIEQKRSPTISDISEKYDLPKDKLIYRADGRIEWICEHGAGHTMWAPEEKGDYGYVHGCCGCCLNISKK